MSSVVIVTVVALACSVVKAICWLMLLIIYNCTVLWKFILCPCCNDIRCYKRLSKMVLYWCCGSCCCCDPSLVSAKIDFVVADMNHNSVCIVVVSCCCWCSWWCCSWRSTAAGRLMCLCTTAPPHFISLPRLYLFLGGSWFVLFW